MLLQNPRQQQRRRESDDNAAAEAMPARHHELFRLCNPVIHVHDRFLISAIVPKVLRIRLNFFPRRIAAVALLSRSTLKIGCVLPVLLLRPILNSIL